LHSAGTNSPKSAFRWGPCASATRPCRAAGDWRVSHTLSSVLFTQVAGWPYAPGRRSGHCRSRPCAGVGSGHNQTGCRGPCALCPITAEGTLGSAQHPGWESPLNFVHTRYTLRVSHTTAWADSGQPQGSVAALAPISGTVGTVRPVTSGLNSGERPSAGLVASPVSGPRGGLSLSGDGDTAGPGAHVGGEPQHTDR
jgi:hypothetical protein